MLQSRRFRISRFAEGSRAMTLGVASCLLAVPAVAEEPLPWASAFQWEAPAECPPRHDVIERLEAVLSPEGVEKKPLDLGDTQIAGSIRHEGSSWRLDLDVADSKGRRTRRLEAHRCDELAQAAALALALLLEERAEEAAAAQRERKSSTAALLPEPSPPPAAALAPEQPARPPGSVPPASDAEAEAGDSEALGLRLAMGADAVVDSSTLTDWALGAGLRTQLSFMRFGLDAHVVLLPAREKAVSDTEAVEFSHFAGGLRLCGAIVQGSWSADVCVGGEAGWISATGVGLIAAREDDRAWLAPSLGLLGGWRGLGQGALTSRFELLLPLLRRDYVINAAEVVHEIPSWTLRWSLGVELEVLN